MSEPLNAVDASLPCDAMEVEEHSKREEAMPATEATNSKPDAAPCETGHVEESKLAEKKTPGKRGRTSDERDAQSSRKSPRRNSEDKSRSRSVRSPRRSSHSRSRRDYGDRRYADEDDYYRYGGGSRGRRYGDDDDRRYERRGSRRGSPARQRSSSRSPSGGRGYHRRSSGGRRSPSPEVDESERDLRTVFAMQLSARLRRSDLVDFFDQAGRVRDAHIVADKGSRRSRGVAYVEFYTIDSAIKAVELSGQRLLDVPIIVQPSEAQKNRQATMKQYSADGAPLSAASSERAAASTLVFARELAVDIEPEDLKAFFNLFGKVEYCHVEPVADGGRDRAEWSAFVKYDVVSSARFAVDKMNGLPLLGAKLRVRMARPAEEEREARRLSEKAAKSQLLQLPPPATTVNPAAVPDIPNPPE
ncbi:splicing factor [Coemansia sp. RSA 2681]|nr:splicing factor [Coemansia sp. RSA 2681]